VISLIGATPPAAIHRLAVFERFPVMRVRSHSTGFQSLTGCRSSVLVFDAAGLALFARIRRRKSVGFGLNPIMAALLGMLDRDRRWHVRDVLLAEVPIVLRTELYAVAALAGAGSWWLQSPASPSIATNDRWAASVLRTSTRWLFGAAGICPVRPGTPATGPTSDRRKARDDD
jgi:uncharacterized membrane protein YeiH